MKKKCSHPRGELYPILPPLAKMTYGPFKPVLDFNDFWQMLEIIVLSDLALVACIKNSNLHPGGGAFLTPKCLKNLPLWWWFFKSFRIWPKNCTLSKLMVLNSFSGFLPKKTLVLGFKFQLCWIWLKICTLISLMVLNSFLFCFDWKRPWPLWASADHAHW